MIPLFEHYTIETLARRTGYSERYLLDLKEGSSKINPRFCRVVSQRLRRSEEELFGPTPQPEVASSEPPMLQ